MSRCRGLTAAAAAVTVRAIVTETPPHDCCPDAEDRKRHKRSVRDDRRERLAAELRENLKRRKAQARSRGGDTAGGGGSTGDVEPNS
ncbi:MAG: hypothetical protein IPM60_02925 [Rhodospirillales bacterium]|nr:hypothetical protein [Rhodospirillales bacterium]